MIQLNKQMFHVYMMLLVFFSMILLFLDYTSYSLILLYGLCLNLGIVLLIKYVYMRDQYILFHHRDMKILLAGSCFPFASRIDQIMILLWTLAPIVLTGSFLAFHLCKRNNERWN